MEVPQNIHFNGIISLYYRQSILGYPILANFHINGSSNYYDGGSVNTSNYVKPYLHPLQQKNNAQGYPWPHPSLVLMEIWVRR